MDDGISNQVRIGDLFGKIYKDKRGVRFKLGTILTQSELFPKQKNESKRPRVKAGDIVTVLGRIPATPGDEFHNPHPGYVKFITERGHVGWISSDCVVPI